MIVVHHLDNSRSQRILWLLEELDISYDIRFYRRDRRTLLAPPELRRIHPLGKSPIITDGDVTIAETGAIVEYILDRYGNGRLIPPAGTPERLRFTYWLHYAEGSAMPPLLLKLVFQTLPERAPRLLRPFVRAIAQKTEDSFIDPQLKTHADFWEAELENREWFCGDTFTAADIVMSFPLEAAWSRAGIRGKYSEIGHFLHQIHNRPAYKRALRKGGDYAYASD